jgi:hypothetical protein
MSYQEERLQEIADAIRTKKGTTEKILAKDFAKEITNLEISSEPINIKALILGTWFAQVEPMDVSLTFNKDNTVVTRVYENNVLVNEVSLTYEINGYNIISESGEIIVYDINTNTMNMDGIVLTKKEYVESKFGSLVNGTIQTLDEKDLSEVATIRPNAFSGIQTLTSVEIPSNVTTIGASAFNSDINLSNVTLKEGVKTIGDDAFRTTSIETIVIPASVTTIGNNVFTNSSLKDVTMEGTVPATLGTGVFPEGTTINVPYGAYDDYVSGWGDKTDNIVQSPAKPSTITVTVNNYLGEMVGGTSVTITGNGQTYTGTTDSVGVFSQGDLQPATYTISVADLEGFKTPDVQDVVVKEDTQNSVIMTYLERSTNLVLGVSWTNDSSTTMTRTDDAVGMTYTINSDGTIQSDFDNVFPFNETEIVEDSYGNKFVRFPEMYFRISKDSNGYLSGVAVSSVQGTEDNWYKSDSFDYACYGASLNDSKLCSVSGVERLSAQTRNTFRSYASNNNETGYVYHQLDLKHKTILMFLWWIEWATKNSASIMTGHIKDSPSLSEVKLSTGGTDNLITPSGYNINTLQMRYHYIEDFIGNLLEFVDGICGGSTSQPDSVTDNPQYFNDTSTSMTTLSWKCPSTNCISAFGMDNDKPFLVMPIKTISSTTYTEAFCDRIYNTSTKYRVVFAGARFNSSDKSTGICHFDRFNESYTGNHVGGRLLRVPV